ncbi:UDP-4-amino-4-deoxy-L-arabinose--oxoglutarate aminotransferase [Treponema primitia ZAS-2]|uniref:UDP-4-amino-4-deoxy-L-arabinose--oxoglutarate aminotransferase n=1 Tax=Treponema primitia (strain ATCC BAA-887 / DSM 12427 / ZAS-2) TaxID=545694 RepID=F5YHU9_TREPZ|nr:DegT/DnrJ/EryC1/StrS family aminotransferase [Treponema primitia]AEF84758.1 UDP-4-amino-4-deoxy-L-arabinose--oxoglutarate aminotransferase [Treponema primitia ZAS-2]
MDTEDIPFARPFVGREEEEAVLRVLRSGWLTTGQEALAFEKEFAAFLETGSPEIGAAEPLSPLNCLAVNSATSGLHLALEACGVGPGDTVLVPSYTFTSTAEVVRYLGAEPVFVDIAPGSPLMDPLALESTLERLFQGRPAYPARNGKGDGFGPRGKPRALIPVHYGGLPCDMKAIMGIAQRYQVKVIEDAAHAFPSRTDAGFAGDLADIGVFSFYATKTITTGEGGMVAVRDKALADRIGIMRLHGIDRTVWNRYTEQKASWYYEVVEPGFKYNMPDILAAIGRVQLGRAWALLEKRRNIAATYDAAFAGDGRFALPPSGTADARHLYPLGLNLETLALSRDTIIEKLQERGIGVSVHFIPLHTMPYYRKRQDLMPGDFPESLKRFQRVISLPIWPGMETAQVERVIAVLKAVTE